MNAKLAGNEEILSSLVTDSSALNYEDILKKQEFIESYDILGYLIHECPDEVTEFDYIVYVINDVHIINLGILPGLDGLMISLDENNNPKVFFGVISDTTEQFIEASKASEDYLQISDEVTSRFFEALTNDPDLDEFVERLMGITE